MFQFGMQTASAVERPPARWAGESGRGEANGGGDFAGELKRVGPGHRATENRRKEARRREGDGARIRERDSADQGLLDPGETAAVAGQNGLAETAAGGPNEVRKGDGRGDGEETRVAAAGKDDRRGAGVYEPMGDRKPQVGRATETIGTDQTAPRTETPAAAAEASSAVAESLTEKAVAEAGPTALGNAEVVEAMRAMIAQARGQATAVREATDRKAEARTERAGGPTPEDAGQARKAEGRTIPATVGAGPNPAGRGPEGNQARARENATDPSRDDGADPAGAGSRAETRIEPRTEGRTEPPTEPQTELQTGTQPRVGTEIVNLDNRKRHPGPINDDAGTASLDPRFPTAEARPEMARTGESGETGLGRIQRVPVNGTGRAAENQDGRSQERKTGDEPVTAGTSRPVTGHDLTVAQARRADPAEAQAATATGSGPGGPRSVRGETVRPDPADIIRQVVARASLRGNGDGGEIRVQLKPEYLGELSLRVTLERGGVTAHLVTQSQAVKEALEAGVPQLKQALEGQGLRADRVAVSLGQDALSAQLGGQGAAAWGQSGDRGARWGTFPPAAAIRPDGLNAPARDAVRATVRPTGGHALDYVA